MKTYRFTRSDAEADADPFADEFTDDLWVCYHGTTSHAEANIDTHGFVWRDESYSYSEVATVLEIFERLHWVGTHSGGYGVLATFTQKDFSLGTGAHKPVYFAESGHRGLLYASRDWAGGETARALRHAFADLETYSSSPKLRHDVLQESFRQLRAFFRGSVPDGCEPLSGQPASWSNLRNLWRFLGDYGVHQMSGHRLEPSEPSEESLLATLDELADLRMRVAEPYETYKYGVVYAVRFEPGDVESLGYDGGGGLHANTSIGSDRILAKAIIEPDVEYQRGSRRGGLDRDSEARFRALEGDGVVASVIARRKQ